MDITLWMAIGFLLAAYSVIANDSLQTLGTFLSVNQDVAWWKLWLAASTIMIVTLGNGWYLNRGDLAFGRLTEILWPYGEFTVWHVIAPASLRVLTLL